MYVLYNYYSVGSVNDRDYNFSVIDFVGCYDYVYDKYTKHDNIIRNNM